VIEHLGPARFPRSARERRAGRRRPGTGKPDLAIAISIRACLKGRRVQFRTATEWVALLGRRRGSLEDELRKTERVRWSWLSCG